MNRKGVALILALATLLVVSGVTTLLFLRTTGEIRHGLQDARIVQTLMLARGAANVTGSYLAQGGREALEGLVRNTASPTGRWAYGLDTVPPGDTPDPYSVALALGPVARALQGVVDGDLCGLNLVPRGLSGRAGVRVYFTSTACGTPLPAGATLPPARFVEGAPRTGLGSVAPQTYALPFVLLAEGGVGSYRRNILLQGEYRFTVGRSSFARYALFTHIHTLPNGTDVWFTDGTLFDGPVHTNSHFRFYRRPWFGGEVTSAGCMNPSSDGQGCGGNVRPGAYFYGAGFVPVGSMRPDPSRPSVTNGYGTHAPEFTAGVDWNASFVPLPQNAQDQKAAAQNAGLYFGNDILSLKFSFRCEGPSGPVACTSPLSPGVVKYQYVEVRYCRNLGCNQQATEVYRYGEDRLLQKQEGSTFSPVLRGGAPVLFNGVIFSDGEIRSISGPGRDGSTPLPALAGFAQITVAASRDIRIQGDLTYEVPPCTSVPKRNQDGTVTPAECPNLLARNVLGIYSQNGNVLIGRQAPNDITVHATLMSASGIVGVEGYDWGSPRGTARILGGVIQKYYGAFGTYDPGTGRMLTGYARAFVYDRRFLQGLAPPFFPTTRQDRVQSISVFSYGQREQVY